MKPTQPYLKDSVKHSRKTAVLALALSLISGNLVAQQPATPNAAAPTGVSAAQSAAAISGPGLDSVTHAPYPAHVSESDRKSVV